MSMNAQIIQEIFY